MNLAVLGINFKTAPLEIRERASFAAADVPAAVARMAAAFPGAELVLLSTCNRTELYVTGVDADTHRNELVRVLLRTESPPGESGQTHFYLKSGPEAAEHLLAVACSLDSMVVGESEIVGQVKQAFAMASEAGTCGRRLNPIFQSAFRCAKRVHSETEINRGRVSVSSVAVEFAQKVFEDLGAKTVMIVGAGETAELSLKSLIDRGARDLLVLNRSMEKGHALAERYGGRAIQFELLDDYLPKADILISSTSAPHVVIHAVSVRRAMASRRGRPVLLIDLAVPRDIDPAVGDVKNVYLYDIDDLQRVTTENLARRREAVDEAWRIVREVSAELVDLFKLQGVGELMQRLDRHGREICESILDRMMNKEKFATLPEASREEIRVLAQKVVNKMLAAPKQALQDAAREGQWEEVSKVTSRLFGLEKTEDKDDRR